MGHKRIHRRPSASHRLSHRETLAQLYAYTHELLIAGSPDPRISEHLAVCSQCRAAFDELMEVTRTATSPNPEPAPVYPTPDLTRLRRPWDTAVSVERPWFIDQLRRLWLEFSQPLLQTWQASPLLGAHRGALLYSFQHPADPPQPGLHLNIYSEDEPALALLSVNIELGERDPLDQSGIPVSLYLGEMRWQAETDQSGSVQFAHIPRSGLDQLRLAITLDQSA